MNITAKTEKIPTKILEYNPKLLEEIKLKQRLDLFRELPIADNQPIVLTFRFIEETSIDPFSTTLTTTAKVDYPATSQVVITKGLNETYNEHKSFWQKLKLLFSKKSIYTIETKEM